jgi:RNA polymerase sigma-70 factor (ECF subfamily)
MTEEAILQGCLKNQAAAQKELYNRYSPKMLAVCYRFAHNREDAEDMLQESFIKVFLQMQFDPGQGRKYSLNRSGKTNCGLHTAASCWI